MSEYKLRPRSFWCKCGHSAYYHHPLWLWLVYMTRDGKPCEICDCPKFEQETMEDRNRSHNFRNGGIK